MPMSTPEREPPFLPFFLAAAAIAAISEPISLVRSRYVASEQTGTVSLQMVTIAKLVQKFSLYSEPD
jgi:hypothetical protein